MFANKGGEWHHVTSRISPKPGSLTLLAVYVAKCQKKSYSAPFISHRISSQLSNKNKRISSLSAPISTRNGRWVRDDHDTTKTQPNPC